MKTQEMFEERLRQAGERVSSARLAVFSALARKGPLPVPLLAATLAKQAIDPATTYRSLNLFRKLGLVRELVVRGKRMIELSDDFSHHHHHFWCEDCGRMTDFDSPAIERGLQAAAKELGVVVSSHQVDMSGLCRDCVKLTPSSSK